MAAEARYKRLLSRMRERTYACSRANERLWGSWWDFNRFLLEHSDPVQAAWLLETDVLPLLGDHPGLAEQTAKEIERLRQIDDVEAWREEQKRIKDQIRPRWDDKK